MASKAQIMERPSDEKPRGSWLAIALVAIVGMMCAGALIFLTLGWFGLVLIIGGGIFGLAALHYCVWGWWLTKVLREEEEAEGRRRQQEQEMQTPKDGHVK